MYWRNLFCNRNDIYITDFNLLADCNDMSIHLICDKIS